MTPPDDNPAVVAMRRTQRVLMPIAVVLATIVVMIVSGWSVTLFLASLLFSAVYIAGVTWGGHTVARLYQRRKGRG